MPKRAQMPKSELRASSPRDARTRTPRPTPLLFLAAGAALLVIIGIVLLQMQAVKSPVETSGRVGEGTSWGPENAKVSIVSYSDFGCSHCRNFALNQGRQLRAEYEAGGSVRFEYRHFIISPPDTADAANASECAADQGRFWDYHDLLFSQQGVSRDPFSKANLKQYGAQLGLDAQEFGSCVDSDTHLEKVYRDSAGGRDAGVQGTPTFLINGRSMVGEMPYEELRTAVEAALTNK